MNDIKIWVASIFQISSCCKCARFPSLFHKPLPLQPIVSLAFQPSLGESNHSVYLRSETLRVKIYFSLIILEDN